MRFVLDYNGLFALEATGRKDGKRIRLSLPEGVYAPFEKHLSRLIEIKDDDGRVYALGAQVPTSQALHVFIDGHDFGTFTPDGYREEHKDYLSVSETRLIGEMPDGKGAVHPRRGDGGARGVITTDLHTHSSSEISGRDLVALAVKHDACYPVRLLTEIGIQADESKLRSVHRVWFPPLEPNPEAIPTQEKAMPVREMAEEERARLAAALNVRADRQSITGEMELDYYRLRYPLAKEPGIFKDIWETIAREYRSQGIHYAEITISTPDEGQLKTLFEVLPGIEKETGVKLRFLIGMPRTLPRPQLHEIIEKSKVLSASPYFMGLDIIGYEVNKTNHFDEELRGMAQWIKEENPDFTLRVHAGENAKNLENVHEVLRIADEFGVRTRIGHAVYGVANEATMALAARLSEAGKLVLEFNIDSNLALNNIDGFGAIPFDTYRKNGIRFVISSDGNGFYQTSARQLEKDLEHAGVSLSTLDAIRSTQLELVDKQSRYSDAKFGALRKKYNGADDAHCLSEQAKELAKDCKTIAGNTPRALSSGPSSAFGNQDIELVWHEELPELLGNRQPVFLFGASGASWRRIAKDQQKEASIAVDMMVHALDPEKTFFVVGRAKNSGLSEKLNEANMAQKQPLYVMSLQTPDAMMDEDNHKVRLDYIKPIENNFVALAKRLVGFCKRHRGEMIGIGGAAFSRDVILKARHEGVGLQVMTNVQGASQEKGGMLEGGYKAQTPRILLRQLFVAHPGWFKQELTQERLDALYEAAEKRYDKKKEEARSTIAPPPAAHDRLLTGERGCEISA